MEVLTRRQFVNVLGLYVGTSALSMIVSPPTSSHKPKANQYYE